MPHPRRHLPLLTLILLLGAALRWIGLGERPPGAYWDEQAIAVNARLLAARGHDQYGARWPLFWRALDDYKAPVFPYSVLAASPLVGDDVLGARRVAALWGVLGLAACWLLTREVLGPGPGPALATAFLAISPWHLHYSRIAWQAITLVTLTSLASAALLRGLRQGPERGRGWLQASAVGLAAVLYTYSAARLWVPLLLLALALACARARRWPWDTPQTARLGLLFAFAALPFALTALTLYEPLTLRFQTITVLDDPQPLRAVLASYLAQLDPGFLFDHGDPTLRHSPPGVGQLLWPQALLIPLGAISLWRRGTLPATFVLAWLVLAPALGALTPGAHATRTIAWLPALQLAGAAGALELLRWRPRLRRPLQGALALAFALSAGAATKAAFRAPTPEVRAAWQADVPARVATALRLRDAEDLGDVVFLPGTDVSYMAWLYATRPPAERFAGRAAALAAGRDRYDPFDAAGKFWFLGARFPAADAPVTLGPAELLVTPPGVDPPGLTRLHADPDGIAYWRTSGPDRR